MKNLAESAKLPPLRETWVAWMETEHNGEDIGQINSSNGLLSCQLRALLIMVSPFKPTRVFIAADDFASAPFPGRQMIISTGIFD